MMIQCLKLIWEDQDVFFQMLFQFPWNFYLYHQRLQDQSKMNKNLHFFCDKEVLSNIHLSYDWSIFKSYIEISCYSDYKFKQIGIPKIQAKSVIFKVLFYKWHFLQFCKVLVRNDPNDSEFLESNIGLFSKLSLFW